MDAAKAVISKLLLKKFMPVENAFVQSTYRMIEAHALKRDTLTQVTNIAFTAVNVRCDVSFVPVNHQENFRFKNWPLSPSFKKSLVPRPLIRFPN